MNIFKHTGIAILLGLLPFITSAQEICGTDIYLEEQIQNDPSIRQQVEAIWEMDGLPANASSHRNGPYIIPVVFHVVHDNGIGNIPYEQLLSAVEVLNEDFRRTNADTGSTRAIFQPYAVDSEVEFRLARLDPDGNCTNGVVRINSPENTYDIRNEPKSTSYWPSNQYLNIWVVNSISSSSSSGGTVLGFAQFPGSGSWSTYGIVVRHDRIGKSGVGTSVSDGRTLTHEVGHCLNLLHTFQSRCGYDCSSSGDRVCDTPPSYEATYYCSNNQNTCNNDSIGTGSVYGTDVVDQIENYMSYDQCQNMFSAGQRSRMHNVLENIGQLVNLVSTQNLIATGVYDPQDVLCTVDFEVESQVICVGQPVTFTDLSYFNPVSHYWEFEGGYPNTSTTQNPTIVYTQPGEYNVQLTIGDGTDSLTDGKTAFIKVLPYPGTAVPLEEGFEFSTSNLESENWFADNLDNSSYGWAFNSNEAFSGNSCVKMHQYGYEDGNASLVSPSYGLSNLQSATVSFKTAYAQQTNTNNDILRVYVSQDCGENWTLRYVTGGSALASISQTSSPISNLTQSDWMDHSFAIESVFLTENTRLRFYVTTDGGNDLFLDNINISGVLDTIPVLVYPLDGASSSASGTTLDWKAASASSFYELQVDTDTSFSTSNLISVQKNYIGISSGDTDTEHDITGLTVGQTYYWRVRTATSDWSETWMFTADDSEPVGVESLKDVTSISLYPNPSTGLVNVVSNQNGEANIMVYNTLGQVVVDQQNYIQSGIPTSIDLSQMANGWYIIETNQNQMINREKVIIQHR